MLDIIKAEGLDRHTDYDICISDPRKGGKRIAGIGDRGSGVHGIFRDEDGMWYMFHQNERGGVVIAKDADTPLAYTEAEACHALLDMLRSKKAFSKESEKLKRHFAIKKFFRRTQR